MMLPTGRAYIRQAFSPRVFAGLGAMTREEAIAALVAGAGPETEAFKTYYGEGGYYSQAESVQRAEEETSAEYGGSAPPSEMPPPQLYAAEPCGPTDGACIQRNEERQLANMAILENARRAWNLEVCEYNAAINPGTSTDQPCGQFAERVPVPPATGVMQTAVCTGGGCYTPQVGDVGTAEQFNQQYTSTGVRRTTAAPNQTVPPRPQAGEVPAGDAGAVAAAPGRLPFGLSANTLLIAGAALAAVLLLKGK